MFLRYGTRPGREKHKQRNNTIDHLTNDDDQVFSKAWISLLHYPVLIDLTWWYGSALDRLKKQGKELVWASLRIVVWSSDIFPKLDE